MANIIIGSAITGAATLASAYALQKLYEKTNFYPPSPVFWFFIGVTAHVGLSLSSKLLSSASLPALPGMSGLAGLAGFGETVEELDKKIDTYQKHIAALNKVMAAGTPAGKQQAALKLAAEQGILDDLLAKREDFLQD
jgi:hypothetical protein